MKSYIIPTSTFILALSSVPSFADDYMFVQTNEAKNSIIQYELNDDGTLKMMRKFPTGGQGTGELRPLHDGKPGPDPLASSDSLIIDEDEDLLFAVNAGDGSVSVFKLDGDNEPKLLDTEVANGKFPNTLAYNDETNMLYVGHLFGPDHIRYMKFEDDDLVLQDGAISVDTKTKAGRALSSLTLSPDGNRLIATVLTDPKPDGSGRMGSKSENLGIIDLDDKGVPGDIKFVDAGGDEPFVSIFLNDDSTKLLTVFSESNGIILNQISEDGSVTKLSYAEIDASVVGGKPLEYCWLSFSPNQEYAYLSSFGTGDLTSIKIDGDRLSVAKQGVGRVEPNPDNAFMAAAGVPSSGAVDSWASEDGYLYQIYGAAGKLGAFRMTDDGGLEEVGIYDVPVNSTQGIAGY